MERVMVFLDNAGTTKMFEECVDVHKRFSCQEFYNPSAVATCSLEVSKLLNETEQFFLKKLGVKEGNIVFTGCATESNNLAVKGSLRNGDWEYVFSAGEHPSVYNIAKKLQLDGYKVYIVPLDKNGCVDIDKLSSLLNQKTRFISVMHVSNETGAINDLKAISLLKDKLCPRAIFHVDGVQGFMKIPFSLKNLSVDLYSFSAHKIHGPKGVAGLYIKNKSGLKELFQGGGQQYGVRSGTENVSGIMQFRKCVEMIDVNQNFENVANLRKRFNELFVSVDGIKVLDFKGSPYIESLIFEGVKGETMLHALNQKGVVVGLGSACSSKKAGNRILEEIGLNKNDIISSVRVSFNAYQLAEEVLKAGEIIVETYKNIREKVS